MEVQVLPGAFYFDWKNRFMKRQSTAARPNGTSFPNGNSILFQTMLDRIGDEVMLIRSDSSIAYVNQATVRGLGYSREYLRGRSVLEFHKNKISLEQWKKDFLHVLQKTKKPINFNIERVGKNGKVQTISITAVCVPFDGEDCILSVARDISGQLALERQLRESEELYRALAEDAPDCIVTSDLVGRITYINKAGENLLKRPSREVLLTHFSEYVDRRSLAKAFRLFYDARQGISMLSEEVEIVDAKGRVIPVDVHVTPLYKSGKVFQLHAVVRDITKRKDLEKLQRESDKTQALTHFISGTIQQVQHPLLAVRESLQHILKTYKNRDFEYIGFKDFRDIVASLENIAEKINRCHETTGRLLSISEKKLGLKKKISSVNTIIREAVNSIDPRSLPPGVKLQLRLSGKDPQVAISEVELTQIILSLLANAIQAMRGGGVIVVKTTRDDVHHKATISVQDQGIGIKKEHLTRVFEPFFTTKQIGVEKGSGLGLSVVHAVVNARHGRINIKSSLREGTLVKVEFPLARK